MRVICLFSCLLVCQNQVFALWAKRTVPDRPGLADRPTIDFTSSFHCISSYSPRRSDLPSTRPTSTRLHGVKLPRNAGYISDSMATKIGVSGVISNVVCYQSLLQLNRTGCGLPAGPLGLIGLGEGISYLVVIYIAGLSLVTKVQTGSGLAAGPYGLLGLSEGLSYVTILFGLGVTVVNLLLYGFVSSPTDVCPGAHL